MTLQFLTSRFQWSRPSRFKIGCPFFGPIVAAGCMSLWLTLPPQQCSDWKGWLQVHTQNCATQLQILDSYSPDFLNLSKDSCHSGDPNSEHPNYGTIQIQWKPLNVITLGQYKSSNINQICPLFRCHLVYGPFDDPTTFNHLNTGRVWSQIPTCSELRCIFVDLNQFFRELSHQICYDSKGLQTCFPFEYLLPNTV